MKLAARMWLLGAVVPVLGVFLGVVIAGKWFRHHLEAAVDRALLAQAAVESVSLFDGPGGRVHLHMATSPLIESVRLFAPTGDLFGPDGRLVMSYPPRGTSLDAAADRLLPSEPGEAPRLTTRWGSQGVRFRELTVTVAAPHGGLYTLRLAASLAQLDGSARAFYRTTLSLSPESAQGHRSPQPLPTDDFTLLKLWLSVQELTTSMFLPSRSWSLAAVRRQTRTLRANYQRQRQAHQQRGPGMPSLLSTLSEIDTALAHIEQRLRIVQRAGRRMRTLIRQAQRLLARTLSQPFNGFFYRRRVYRKLLREGETLTSLLWALNVQDSIFPAELATAMQDTFLALHNRYGMPLSDSAMRRLVANIPLADRLPLASAMSCCECRVCIHVRQHTRLDAEEELALVSSCPCAFCAFCRTTLPKIDISRLEHAPTFRGALLALRRRVGGASSIN